MFFSPSLLTFLSRLQILSIFRSLSLCKEATEKRWVWWLTLFFFMTVEYADMWSKRKKYLENTARLMLTEKSAKYIFPPFRQIHKYTVTATTIVSKCVWQTVWRVKKIITLFANRQSIKKKVFLWLTSSFGSTVIYWLIHVFGGDLSLYRYKQYLL